MVAGPMRKGWPQETLKLGISVVKATTVVGRSSRGERWTAGQKRTSRASILNAAAMRATAARVEAGSPTRRNIISERASSAMTLGARPPEVGPTLSVEGPRAGLGGAGKT